MVKNLKLGLVFGSLVLVAFMIFVTAVDPGLITGLNFTNNATPSFDEGNFTLNWTAATGSNATAYNITIWVDDAYWTTGVNDSELGYSFNNWTDGNYTFAVVAWNSTDADGVNSTNISMVVDRTNPATTIVYPTNISYAATPVSFNYTYVETNCDRAWYSNNTGVTNSSDVACGTNFSDMIAVEGGNNWTIFVNDSIGNENSTVVYFTLDTTNPVATLSCTPSSVSQNSVVTCTCGGSDGGSGINSTLTSAATTPSTADTGTYTAACSVTDNAGNSDTASTTYSVTGLSSSGSGGSSSTSFWTYGTHSVAKEQFALGFTKQLSIRQRVKVQVGSSDHYVGVVGLTATTAIINISSDPQQVVLSVGDEEKFEVSGDDYYDILVRLNSIEDNKANVTIESINELIVFEEVDNEETVTTSIVDDVEDVVKDNKNVVIWVIVGMIIVGIGVGVFVLMKKKKLD